MEAVLIIGIFLSLFLAALIFSRTDKSLADVILGSFFLLYALNILLSYGEYYNRQQGYPYPGLIHVATPFLLLHGPALWFYIKSLTAQYFRFRWIYLLHFLPFVLLIVEHSVHFYLLSPQDRIDYVTKEAFRQQPSYYVVVVGIAVSQLGYFAWGLSIIQRYRKKLKTYFSHLQSYDLTWLRFLLTGALVCYGIIHALYLTDFFAPVAPFGMLQMMSYSLGSLYLVFLGFFGLRQGNLFETYKINLDLDKAIEKKEQEKTLYSKEERFIKRLQEHMKDSKPYLLPDLNIARLSEQLDVTPGYLSRILNNHMKRSFFDFINHYRIEEFKDRCRNPENKHITLIGLAYESGFNSKATFNRVFKKLTGTTPGAYYRQVSKI